MGKFDLFDRSTWDVEVPTDPEVRLRNRALGAIGQKVGELRKIKERIQAKCRTEENRGDDFKIAAHLLEHCPDIAKLMGIQIIYPTSVIEGLFKDIDEVIEFWQDVGGREYRWRLIVPVLERLKSYFQSSLGWGSPDPVPDLIKVKVSGNGVWDFYLASELRNEVLKKENSELRARSLWHDEPESHDDLDDLDNDD